MSQRVKILVAGSANMDLVVKADSIPAPGETVLGGEFQTIPGGKGANQAVAAARLGGETRFLGRVGSDAFGDALAQELAKAGVLLETLLRDPSAPSGVALIGVDSQGRNAIMVAPGANGRLSAEDVYHAKAAIEASDWLVAQLEIPLDTVFAALRVARQAGRKTLLNPAPVRISQPLPDAIFPFVDVLTPNEHEAAAILGRESLEAQEIADAAQAIREKGVGSVVITLGSEGCLCATESGVLRVSAPKVTAADTTAAGDCFTGALAVALGEGAEWSEALSFAIHAASLSVTRMGAQPSLPFRYEVALR